MPEDPNSPGDLQPPYRLFVDQAAPEDSSQPAQDVWSLTSTFVPFGKSNLASFVSVNSDATTDDYGKITVRELSDQTVQGPGLIANEFSNDDKVRDALLPFQSGQSPPLFGNLLTLPVEDGLIYIEPVYAVRSGSTAGFPILRFVLVSYGGEVGIGTTLSEAVGDALGVDPDAPVTPTPDPDPSPATAATGATSRTSPSAPSTSGSVPSSTPRTPPSSGPTRRSTTATSRRTRSRSTGPGRRIQRAINLAEQRDAQAADGQGRTPPTAADGGRHPHGEPPDLRVPEAMP